MSRPKLRKRTVRAPCPSCKGERALEHNWDGHGDCTELKCRGCGKVFPARRRVPAGKGRRV